MSFWSRLNAWHITVAVFMNCDKLCSFFYQVIRFALLATVSAARLCCFAWFAFVILLDEYEVRSCSLRHARSGVEVAICCQLAS